jgi:hypothetical protein
MGDSGGSPRVTANTPPPFANCALRVSPFADCTMSRIRRPERVRSARCAAAAAAAASTPAQTSGCPSSALVRIRSHSMYAPGSSGLPVTYDATWTMQPRQRAELLRRPRERRSRVRSGRCFVQRRGGGLASTPTGSQSARRTLNANTGSSRATRRDPDRAARVAARRRRGPRACRDRHPDALARRPRGRPRGEGPRRWALVVGHRPAARSVETVGVGALRQFTG